MVSAQCRGLKWAFKGGIRGKNFQNKDEQSSDKITVQFKFYSLRSGLVNCSIVPNGLFAGRICSAWRSFVPYFVSDAVKISGLLGSVPGVARGVANTMQRIPLWNRKLGWQNSEWNVNYIHDSKEECLCCSSLKICLLYTKTVRWQYRSNYLSMFLKSDFSLISLWKEKKRTVSDLEPQVKVS